MCHARMLLAGIQAVSLPKAWQCLSLNKKRVMPTPGQSPGQAAAGIHFEIEKAMFGFSRRDAFGTAGVYPVFLTGRE